MTDVEKDIGNISDGYHTFNDLYKERLYLSAALFNAYKDRAWKSRNHSDGTLCFDGGGWFIVGINTPLGQYTYHYNDQYWEMFDCKELETAPEWDGHTELDVSRLESLRRPKVVSEPVQTVSPFTKILHHICRAFHQFIQAIKDMFKPRIDWASQEVKLACAREREDNHTLKGEWDYGCACYESALKAYRSLGKVGHSGFSIMATRGILNRLIEHKPLTPIEDTPDVWDDISEMSDLKEEAIYQCKRMSALFKYVRSDGTIKYKDVESYYCIDVTIRNIYHNGLVQKIMDEMFPITMPYWAKKTIGVFCQECLTDRKNGDYDTVGVLYCINSDGEHIEINRFFKEIPNQIGYFADWEEITIEEYFDRNEIAERIKER